MRYKYPDLSNDMQALLERVSEVGELHKPLIEKWVLQLAKLHKEMRHLERIESFSEALKEMDKDSKELHDKR